MVTFSHSITINRPLKEVWAFVSDISNHPKFGPQVSAEWTSAEPHGAGSTTRSSSRFLGRTIESTGQVTIWEPPRRFASSEATGSINSRSEWTFDAQDGGTLLTFSGEAEIGGFFKIAESLVARQIDRQVSTDLGALKLILEAG